MLRFAGLILACGMILGTASSADAQLAISVGNPYGYGMNPYGYAVPATTFYSSGYGGFVGSPLVGGYPAYGYRNYGYRPYGYGYRNYGYRGYGRGYGRGFGFGRRWR